MKLVRLDTPNSILFGCIFDGSLKSLKWELLNCFKGTSVFLFFIPNVPKTGFSVVDVPEAGPQLVQMFIGSLARYGEWRCWLNGLVHILGRKTPLKMVP